MSELRHVLDIKNLRSVYYAIFGYHSYYASLAWVQNTSSVKRLHLLQNKIFREEIPTQVRCLKTPKSLSPLIRRPLKIPCLLTNI